MSLLKKEKSGWDKLLESTYRERPRDPLFYNENESVPPKIHGGRPRKKIDLEVVHKLLDMGKPKTHIAEMFDVNVATLNRRLKGWSWYKRKPA